MSPQEYHLQLAATAWCSEKTASIVMDTELCRAFANILAEAERVLSAMHEKEIDAAIAKYEHLLHQFQALRDREQSIRPERDTLLQSNSK